MKGLLAVAVGLLLFLTGGYFTQRIEARASTAAATAGPTPATAPAGTPIPDPSPTPVGPPPRSTAALAAAVQALAANAGAEAGVSLVELGGTAPLSWSDRGDTPFVAASTYKLPLLMDQAQLLAAGAVKSTDSLCFTDADWEDGWFDDYADGECYSRQELAARAGLESDNTAAHILADSIGGSAPLNSYARAHGATASAFYDPNTTTADDLARLWVDEATGRAGGAAAQSWLYPLLTHTAYESGIPGGTPGGTAVVHKIGALDGEVNDAALVAGPSGAYVLVVMTDGPGGDAGWSLVAAISAAVWHFEAARA